MKKGRPAKEFDLAEVEKLGMLGATAAEIAAWFGVGLRTVERRMQQRGEFRQAYERGFARMKISLRRRQIESAKDGNVTMLIWLGKQFLSQAEKQESRVESEVTQKVTTLPLSPEDEEFLRKTGRLRASIDQGTNPTD